MISGCYETNKDERYRVVIFEPAFDGVDFFDSRVIKNSKRCRV